MKTNKEFLFSSWAIDHKTVIYVIMGIFLILGVNSYISMPRENFPEINDTKVFVSTVFPGNTAEDIERLVTAPLEEALKGVSNLVDITSTSSEDFSIEFVELFVGHLLLPHLLLKLNHLSLFHSELQFFHHHFFPMK